MHHILSTAALPWAVWAALLGYGAACALALAGQRRPAAWCGLLGLAANGWAVGLVCLATQRLPLLGAFETISETAFLLGLLAAWDSLAMGRWSRAATWCWGFCTIMLGVLLFMPHSLTPDSFMFDYPWLLAFFQLRMASIALLLFAAAMNLAGLHTKDEADARWSQRRGRTFLLAGWAAFLSSEYSGAYWSYQWLGDFWSWNSGFLESTLLFLVIAVPLHLPRSWRASRRVVLASGAAPGLVIAIVTIIHQVGRS